MHGGGYFYDKAVFYSINTRKITPKLLQKKFAQSKKKCLLAALFGKEGTSFMDTLSYKTKSAKLADNKRSWWIIDARDMIVGRLASEIAKLLRGKHKPYYTPHTLCGDAVVIINADKVRFTGRKLAEKEYIRHTGYPGGQRFTTPRMLLTKHPIRVMEYAIKGMLPKNKLGAKMYRNLHVYAGDQHPHAAQNLQQYSIKAK